MNDTHQDDVTQKPMTRRQLLASMGAAGALLAAGAGLGGGSAYAASTSIPDTSTGPFYNVKDFGAKGNGRLDDDDGIAIQAAIDTAASRGGTVYLPPGTYYLKRTLFMKSKVHLLGAGPEAAVIKASEVNLTLITTGSYTSYFSVEGITFEGLGAPSGAKIPVVERGIFAQESSYFRINRCVFKYIANGVYLTRADHAAISNCSFNFILGTDVGPYEGYGIYVEGGTNHTIQGNYFKNIFRNGIYVTAGSSYSIIANNVLESCQDSAILLSSKLTACAHHLLTGNLISAAGLGDNETSSMYGIRLKDACSLNTLTNNVISRAASAGIQLDADENAGDDRPYSNTITGNTIDVTVRGIAVLNGDSNTLKSNEVRKAETGVLIDTIGEGSGSLAKGNVITNNSLFQCSAAAVRIGSSRCQSNTVFGNAGAGNAQGLKDSGTDTATAGF